MNTKYVDYLEDYATYHRHPHNKLTHYLGIPMILFAVIGLLRTLSLGNLGSVELDVALLVMAPVLLFYLSLNPATGMGMVVLFALMYLVSPRVGVIGLWALFLLGWIFQFIGHHFEGKKPAFFRNAVHLLVGPLWILNDLYATLHLPAYKTRRA